jgi:hypothetical protein
LKLTKVDEMIYQEFRSQFSDLNVQLIDENILKSNDSKEVCLFKREREREYLVYFN